MERGDRRFPIQLLRKPLQVAFETEYYREKFLQNNIQITEIKNYEDFSRIPITTKEDYRKAGWKLVRDGIRKKMDMNYLEKYHSDFKKLDQYLEQYGLILTITSGSTGIPLSVIHSKADEYRNYFSLNRYRRRHSGFSPKQPYIWLLPMNPMTHSYFYDGVEPYISQTNGIDYFLSDYHSIQFDKLYTIICQKGIQWITGSPTSLYEFARYIELNGLKMKFQYIELHSEPVFDWQIKQITKTFGSIPVSVYSSNEALFIAATCSYGQYHVLEDNVYLELLDSGVPGLKSKRVIITCLNNLDCPILRYDIGDMATFEENMCPCEKKSLKLTGYRDSDMIIIGDHIYEPYIIYDSIYFLEKELDVIIQYYWVQQTDYRSFSYTFEDEDWNNDIKERIHKFLVLFLCQAFMQKITVDIRFCTEQELAVEKRRKKYKRFFAMKKENEE